MRETIVDIIADGDQLMVAVNRQGIELRALLTLAEAQVLHKLFGVELRKVLRFQNAEATRGRRQVDRKG